MKQPVCAAALLAMALSVAPAGAQQKVAAKDVPEQTKPATTQTKSKQPGQQTRRKAGGSQQDDRAQSNASAKATKKPDKASPNLMNKSGKDR